MAPQISTPILAEHRAYMTGHTFSGHTAACAAGLAVQRIIERDALVERVRTTGAAFQESVRRSLSGFDEVGDVRGRGFFIGVELVRDRCTRTAPDRHRSQRDSHAQSAARSAADVEL